MAKELFYVACLLILTVNLCQSLENVENNEVDYTDVKCGKENRSACVKLEVIKIIDVINQKDFKLNLYDGVTLVKESNRNEIGGIKEFISKFDKHNDPNHTINTMLASKLIQLILSPSVKINFLSSKESDIETGRGDGGKLGKKGGMEQLLSAAMMMKGTLLAIAMSAIAAIAGKALLAGFMALTLSSIVGLKSLTGGSGKKTTYEILPKPVYSHSQSSSSSHENHGHHGSQFYYRSFEPQ